MKQFLKKGFFFILLLPASYILILFICVLYVPIRVQKNLHYVRFSVDHLYTKIREADTVKNVNILVLGASSAYRGYDPRIFNKAGIKAFNLGSSSQTPIQTQYLINKYIDKIKPKIVLYDVEYKTFELDAYESSIDLFSNVPEFDWPLFKMAFELKSFDGYNTFNYAYLSSLLKKEKNEPKIAGMDTYIPNGFVERKTNVNEYKGGFFDKKSIRINQKQFNIFVNICKTLNSRGIKVILIQSPTSGGVYQSIKNRDSLDQLFSRVKPASYYYNFNDTAVFKNSLFFDGSHLNQQGVEVFNNALIERLKQTNILLHPKRIVKTEMN